MKTKIINSQGKEGKEIDLPSLFSGKVREDLAQKYYELLRHEKKHVYGSSPLAGKMFSALGKVGHRRHKFRSHYGRGISRVPRKVFWRRGTQFYWEGAGISSTKGGRRAHPPKPVKRKKKINKKEKIIAMKSVLASTINPEFVKKRYSSLEDKEIKKLPVVVDNKLLDMKTKEFFQSLEKILGDLYDISKKKIRKVAGKGKRRTGKKRKSAGLLLVIGNEEKSKVKKGVDVRKVLDLDVDDLWPLGRLTLYTEKAIEDLKELFNKQKGDKK